MLRLKEAVIVEGKYDKIKLSSIIDAVIIPTGGFTVFKDREKLELIRYFAAGAGIIILTDSDAAGFRIRSFLKGAIKGGRIVNVYIPDVFGKERRKAVPSKEGKIGVEGIDKELILEAFRKAGIDADDRQEPSDPVTKADFYEAGFSGGENSSAKRKKLLNALGLPELLTANGIIDVINASMTKDEFFDIAKKINNGEDM